jgi:hypothetical protein
MLREPHENVATVLVDPVVLAALELHLMGIDMRLWPVASAPTCVDGRRQSFQIRRRMIDAHRGEWDDAADWVPAWISFGDSWRFSAEPIPWEARRTLYAVLDGYGVRVRYRRGLGGVPPLAVPHEEGA